VCGVELARNGFDHVPAGGGQTPVVRHQPAGPGDEQAAALLSHYQPTKFAMMQLKGTVGITRGRFGLSAGYQSHSLELRHLNLHNTSRVKRGTRTSHLSARGCAWVRGPSRDLSMRNGPTKTFDVARQFHFSRLT
jgi:hypothetical protein